MSTVLQMSILVVIGMALGAGLVILFTSGAKDE